jgi:CheY-like chemotaxis protein
MAKKKLTETNKFILWVNDHLSLDEDRYHGFMEKGVIVVCAASTGKAIDLFGRARYDAVVTDLRRLEYGQKNDSAGIELTQQIRTNNNHIPIFIYTMNIDSSVVNLAKRAGATMITTNPVELDAALRQHQLIT